MHALLDRIKGTFIVEWDAGKRDAILLLNGSTGAARDHLL